MRAAWGRCCAALPRRESWCGRVAVAAPRPAAPQGVTRILGDIRCLGEPCGEPMRMRVGDGAGRCPWTVDRAKSISSARRAAAGDARLLALLARNMRVFGAEASLGKFVVMGLNGPNLHPMGQ